MIHRHHAAERTGLGLDQNAWVSFGKQGWVNSRECRRRPTQPVTNAAIREERVDLLPVCYYALVKISELK
jgi:hypothetical protein